MGKTILFSPVGITDPVSPKNFYDGSMLHICRHLKPDVVYLYLSSEMTEKEHSDHRFTRAINLLSKKINHEIKVHLIEKPDLVKAHEFDFFFEEFGQILKKLTADKAKDDTLLINISSGTPGILLSEASHLSSLRRSSSHRYKPQASPEALRRTPPGSSRPGYRRSFRR